MLKYTTKLFIITLAILSASIPLSAQVDPVFSQFYASPFYLNPAMIGVFKGSFRFNANYREQWTDVFSNTPVTTIQAAFDTRIRVMDEDYLGLGLNAMQDQLGGDGSFKSTEVNLGFSYMKQLNGSRYKTYDQYLIMGAQVGLGQQSFNYNGLWFDRQYDPINVDVNFNLPSGVTQPVSNKYLDLNAGLMWYALFDDNQSIYVGAAMSHINKPSISFYNSADAALYRRYTLHGGGEIPFSKELSLLPAIIVTSQGPSLTSEFGANFRYSNHDWNEAAVRIGAWYRFAGKAAIATATTDSTHTVTSNSGSIQGNALVFAGILELDRWQIGVSYDIQVSQLAVPTNSRGGLELSLIYIHPAIKTVSANCPKF